MKKVLLVIALVLIIALPLSAANYSKTNGVGVGLNLGFPFNGVAVKYGMDDFRAVGTVGWDLNSSNLAIEAGAQYDVYEFDIEGIPFYVNAGVTANIGLFGNPNFTLAVAVPVGLSYFFEEMPIEAFLKLAPAIAIVPSVGWGGINASIGGLWYFE
jgi:predicted small secreted protein